MKLRQNLYIDLELSRALDMLAAAPGATKSGVVNEALGAWIRRRGAAQVDDALKLRLDRMSRELGRIGRDMEVLLESLSLFVRYQLTVTAPLPEADSAARAAGRERFEAFVAQVGRQIGSGRRSIPAADGEGGQ